MWGKKESVFACTCTIQKFSIFKAYSATATANFTKNFEHEIPLKFYIYNGRDNCKY